MHSAEVLTLACAALQEIKAIDLRTLDVRDKTSITDYMLICSGSSERHVRSLAENVQRRARQRGIVPLGVEGLRGGEWVLVDLGEVIVHAMLPQARSHYQLEKLWAVELDDVAEQRDLLRQHPGY